MPRPESTLANLLAVFDVEQTGPHRYRGNSDPGDRDLIDASQALAQSVVAATKSGDGKVVRRASGVFCRPIRAESLIDFGVDVVHAGRSFATVVVTVAQGERTCGVVTLMLDRPVADVIRHPVRPPDSSPETAIPYDLPLPGRELRLVDVVDPNDPDEVGPPRLEAWLRYDPVPSRDDLQRALLAHFTGHLSISTTMRAHPGIGTAMSHKTVSTAVMAIDISFHDPIAWDGWIVYDHESTAVGAGMSYVRGQIRDEAGRLIASFAQDGLIKAFDEGSSASSLAERARL
ncbi:MAG TPA: acyl-CoA thioesterase domain-containing protein [Mycobacteriales bacterium]|jgi:acyl-CoA thioesterase|nr:acyl-CoA thioesterase domain-containing protein [Mycobacteriales bacterium]